MDEYILIRWPWVQELMDCPWFRKECYLLQAFDDQEHIDSSYFVPKHRIKEIEQEITEAQKQEE